MTANIMTYDTLPDYPLVEGQLIAGYAALAERLVVSGSACWSIDGMSGVNWEALENGLQQALADYRVVFIETASARVEAEAVREILADFLDNGDVVFGKLYTGKLVDFFDPVALEVLRQKVLQAVEQAELVVCFGQGSSLLNLDGGYIWAALPKETITDRASRDHTLLLLTPPFQPL